MFILFNLMIFKRIGSKLHKRTYSMENSTRATEESHKPNSAVAAARAGSQKWLWLKHGGSKVMALCPANGLK